VLDLTKKPLSEALFTLENKVSEAVHKAFSYIPTKMAPKTRLAVLQGLVSVEAWYMAHAEDLAKDQYGRWQGAGLDSLDKFLSYYTLFHIERGCKYLMEMGVEARTWGWFSEWMFKKTGITLVGIKKLKCDETLHEKRMEESKEIPERGHISIDAVDPESIYYEMRK